MVKEEFFYDSVMSCIREHQLVGPDDKILVALSGGADSVALLLVLQQAGFHCEAVHCNFHLRGEESDRDEKFVRDLCRSRSIRLHTKDFDTAAYARQKGISIEMAARELRYGYFEELRADWRFDKIAVAHHRDDNVETLLLHLVRGTGLKGLTGMRYHNGYVIRPMLDTNRKEIERYLAGKGQPYVTDSTNLETEAVRNKIRLEFLPMLKTVNPSILDTLQGTIRHLEDAYTLYNMAVEDLKARICRNDRIDIQALKAVPAARTVLFELLSAYGFNSVQAEEIFDHLDGCSGKVYESHEWRLLRDRKTLVLSRKDEQYKCLCHVLPLEGCVKVTQDLTFLIRRVHYDRHFTIPRSKDTVCLDLDKIEYPIMVRLVQEGDRFVPFGMTGQKLVSDYLTNCQKNLFEKERQLVVCSGEHIAWLVNERSDNRFRIDDKTNHVLIIQCQRTPQAS